MMGETLYGQVSINYQEVCMNLNGLGCNEGRSVTPSRPVEKSDLFQFSRLYCGRFGFPE